MLDRWTSLTIKNKLAASIILLTAVLVLSSVALAGVLAYRTQTRDLWAKGHSLVRALSPAAGPCLGGNDMGTTSKATEGVLDLARGDGDVSFAAVAVVDRDKVELSRLRIITGEGGKGFAVVAEEVRKLAERAAQAVREAATRVRASAASVENGSALVAQAGTELQGLAGAIRASSGRIEAIGGRSRAQGSDGVGVARTMDQLTAIADRNAAATGQMAATLRETARTVEDLAQAAEPLRSLVGHFKV